LCETTKAFVALLVFWLALLFASFGLFAPPNLTSAVTLTLCALAVAGAVAMFLELEQGFGGNVRISPEPMRQAVKTLQAEPSTKVHLSGTSRPKRWPRTCFMRTELAQTEGITFRRLP